MQGDTPPVKVDEAGLRKHFLTLTDTQKQFVRLVVAWSRNPRKLLLVLSGGPGTGKTYVAQKTLDYVQTEQLRMSYTARSAQAIGGRTIHSTVELDWQGLCRDLEVRLADEKDLVASIRASSGILNEFTYYDDPQIIVLDEVSMVSGWLMYWLLRFFMERTTQPLLFIAIGDPHQLNPVKSAHNLFSFNFLEMKWPMRMLHLKESKRFAPEYERRIQELRAFVDADDETGLFTFLCEHFPVCPDIEGTHLEQADRAMAARNERVNAFNAYYLKHKVAGPEVRLQSTLVLKPGCIVTVTKNGCSSVANGTELRFLRYRPRDDRVVCLNPLTNGEVTIRREVEKHTFPIMLGFAATIHRFQGDTIDRARIVIHLDGNRNLNMAYTAVSRVRSMDQIVAMAL